MCITILGIETSCDETSVAVVENGTKIKANIISSQIEVHQKYGGVVPEIASRKHLEFINSVIEQALDEAVIGFGQIDAIAVTYGPGLVGALLVGVAAGKAIAFGLDVPLIGINHMEGHVYANMLAHPNPQFPVVCLVVSGGHTDLVLIKSHGNYQLIGSTRDDAAGEAFDKVARVLGLSYPGGPQIDNLAALGDEKAIFFPRAYLEEKSLDFSFSGVKTAVINYLNRCKQKGVPVNKPDVAASFRRAVVDVLVDKALQAVDLFGTNTIMLAGGVAANKLLRDELNYRSTKMGLYFIAPPPILCTDNAAMIACAAYYKYMRQEFAPLTLNAVPGLKLGEDRY